MSTIERSFAVPLVAATVVFSATMVCIGWLQLPESTFAGLVFSFVGLPLVLLVLSKRPNVIPYFLVVGIHLGLLGIRLPIANINIRPNMIIAVASCAVVLMNKSYRKRCQVPYISLFLGMNGVYIIATLANPRSQFFWKGIADCILLLINIVQYALIVWFLSSDRSLFDKILRFFIYCSTVFSSAYLFAFTLASFGVSVFQKLLVSFEGETGDFVRVGNLGTTQGSYISFAVTMLLAALLFVRREARWSNLFTAGLLASNMCALALTFARGPWVAVVLSSIFIVVLASVRLSLHQFGAALRTGLILITVVFGAGALLMQSRSDIRQMFTDRFLAFDAMDRGTAAGRLFLWAEMVDDMRNAPLLGHGAHNYAKFRDDDPEHGISENFVIEMLHASGLIGGGLFIAVTVWIILRCSVAFANSSAVENVQFGLPLLAGFLSMYLASLTNPGMWGGYFWAVLGIMVAAHGFARPRILLHDRSGKLD